ncbi:MAG TPA: DinB family protein [Pyrinomonadaceae bacterium]|jgi:uncharacterized damage-inducible protein DinB|nr:DinB family protein [Pyrinomonadaceae bacterium]
MIHHSVAEIISAIDDARARLTSRVEHLSDAEQNFRATPDGWTVAEIVEHLSILEHRMTQLLGVMVKKAEAGGLLRAGDAAFAPVTIADFVEQSNRGKYNAPENVRPSGRIPVADSLARMRESRAALHGLRPQLEQVDGVALQYPHPAFGPLNLYQWLAFIGAHEERHLKQIEALMRSPEFAASATASN